METNNTKSKAAHKYFAKLKVGVAITLSGGVAIGGEGKWAPGVVSVAKRNGLKINKLTGDWFSAEGSKFEAIATALDVK